ncbi:MAG TPA: hypothetical protein DCZ55_24415 [Cyanobacteria bacterium UBA11371]|nr:hypothetical protein [Cyanobacteria bacterium UBA11371]
MTSNLAINQSPVGRFLWLSRLMAMIALINLILVFFDLSYIPWRDVYLQYTPQLTQVYDQVKGIEPHRDIQRYLNQVNALSAQLKESGLEAPEVETSLGELRLLSKRLIEENPFALANKSGQLEKIKNIIRDRTQKNSIHAAFDTFWSQPDLSQAGWQKELDFFNTEVKPLMETNYYRGLGINGKFIDNFWQLDLPFVILFALDFLVRAIAINRQNPALNFLEAMLRRWYDIFLLFPFGRWLRVLPVTLRLNQTDLINLEPIRKQINRDFVANFAAEITEIVGVEIVNQMQEAIGRGDAMRWLFQSSSSRAYITVNNTDELQAIASRLIYLSVYDVLPKIQPELQALVYQIISIILKQSPVYQQVQNLPGLKQLPHQLSENLAKALSQTSQNTLETALQDPEVTALTARLVKNFQTALELELQKPENTQEIQSLLVDMLEEIKINYVKRIEEKGVEEILEESSQLRQIARR